MQGAAESVPVNNLCLQLQGLGLLNFALLLVVHNSEQINEQIIRDFPLPTLDSAWMTSLPPMHG